MDGPNASPGGLGGGAQTMMSPAAALHDQYQKVASFQRGKKPNARDGHTANVDQFGFMFVFGGDRH